mgnify:CR=1 FL=1
MRHYFGIIFAYLISKIEGAAKGVRCVAALHLSPDFSGLFFVSAPCDACYRSTYLSTMEIDSFEVRNQIQVN